MLPAHLVHFASRQSDQSKFHATLRNLVKTLYLWFCVSDQPKMSLSNALVTSILAWSGVPRLLCPIVGPVVASRLERISWAIAPQLIFHLASAVHLAKYSFSIF